VAVRTHIDICFGDSFRHPRGDIKNKKIIFKNKKTSKIIFLFLKSYPHFLEKIIY
jgi:hypothetical protein